MLKINNPKLYRLLVVSYLFSDRVNNRDNKVLDNKLNNKNVKEQSEESNNKETLEDNQDNNNNKK